MYKVWIETLSRHREEVCPECARFYSDPKDSVDGRKGK